MKPLARLAHLCSQIDHAYSVSLQYGAYVGEKPAWVLNVDIAARSIHMVRHITDTQNIPFEAQILGGELERLAALFMAVERGEDKISLDKYRAAQCDNYSAS